MGGRFGKYGDAKRSSSISHRAHEDAPVKWLLI